MTHQVKLIKVLTLIEDCLFTQSSNQSLTWLNNIKKLGLVDKDDQFYTINFSIIPHIFSKATIDLNDSNHCFKNWSYTQLARSFFILTLAKNQPENFKRILHKIFRTADIQELITFYQILSLLPHPETFITQATEGVRSNIASIFNAIALNNTYPANYFEQNAWNQLILKAFFINSPIDQIIGIEKRANPALAYMLIDYAKERLSAHRPVKAELWHIVKISADENVLLTLKNSNINLPKEQHQQLTSTN